MKGISKVGTLITRAKFYHECSPIGTIYNPVGSLDTHISICILSV